MKNPHIPVLMNPVMELLNIHPEGFYADLTAGDGGHSAAIAEKLSSGRLLSIDRDASALERAKSNLSDLAEKITFEKDNFKNISNLLDRLNLGRPDGILVDLGISRYQLTSPERGFSIINDGPLDMRMDREEPRSAADLVNTLSDSELERIFKEYGEERFAKKISRAIVERRRSKKFSTTLDLARLINEVKPKLPAYKQRIHPATQAFQALRIAVNHELEGLEDFCSEAIELLAEEGRLLVISFHSLEDRIIKRRFQLEAGRCICFKPADMCTCHRIKKVEILTKKPVKPDEKEISRNPASRSAKLRAVKKLKRERQGGDLK